MNEILLPIFSGVIQGLTEFLPVSSSGHLVLFHEFFNFDFPDKIAFDVILHLGTLMALLLFFYKDIIMLAKAWFSSLYKWDLRNNSDQRLAWLIILGTIPAALFGLFFEDIIESAFRNAISVGVMLVFFGIVLYAVDSLSIKSRGIKDMEIVDAVVVGFAQVLALIPGVSRSGITIIAGLGRNLKRDEAAKFSFLLSMPIVAAAGSKKIIDLILSGGDILADYQVLVLGFISAALAGYLCIKYFIKFVQKYSMAVFAIYRIVVGLLIIGWWYFF